MNIRLKSFYFLVLSMVIISFASLMFEIILLKQLNFLIGSWSYKASIVLCSFMLGSGIGVLLAQTKKLKISYGLIPILQGLSVIITSFILLRLDIIFRFSTNLIFMGLILSPTFVLFGWLFITILNHIRSEVPDFIRFIYSADLIGAAFGGISTVFITLPLIGINKTVILCIILFFISSLLLNAREGLRNPKIIYFLIGSLTLMMSLNIDPLIEKYRNIKNTPLYKMLKGENGKLLYTGWSPLQRIDIVKFKNSFYLFYDGVAWTGFNTGINSYSVESMIKYMGYDFMSAFYPFMHHPKDILIIGVGAGRDIVYSKVFLNNNIAVNPQNPGSITGIEIDPLVVDLLKNKFKDLNKNIFNSPQVKIIVDDGRRFIETTSKKYDLIHYSYVDTPYAFTSVGVNPCLRAENYLYTVEGLRSAYEKLSEDGALFITLGEFYFEPFEKFDIAFRMRTPFPRLGRLISTFRLILEEKRISRWEDYIEVVGHGFPHRTSPYFGNYSKLEAIIRITKKPIASGQIKSILEKYNLQHRIYFFDKSVIISSSKQRGPITDDRPFYYNFPLTSIPDIIQKNLVFISVLLILYLISSLIYLKTRDKCKHLDDSCLLFIFFGSIGISFMITELLYIQQAIIFLRNSFLGTAILISMLLVFAGIGSIYATDILTKWKNKLFFILILAPIYNFLLPHIITSTKPLLSDSSIYLKTVLLSVLIFPLGFFMGTFFPLGLLLSNQLEAKINFSWLYAMDILGSIVGILLGICLPIKIGYSKSIYYLSYLLFIQVILVFYFRKLSIVYNRAE